MLLNFSGGKLKPQEPIMQGLTEPHGISNLVAPLGPQRTRLLMFWEPSRQGNQLPLSGPAVLRFRVLFGAPPKALSLKQFLAEAEAQAIEVCLSLQ